MIILCNADRFVLEAPYDYKVMSMWGGYALKFQIRHWVDSCVNDDIAVYYINGTSLYDFKIGIPDETSSAFVMQFEPESIYKDLQEYVDFLTLTENATQTWGGPTYIMPTTPCGLTGTPWTSGGGGVLAGGAIGGGRYYPTSHTHTMTSSGYSTNPFAATVNFLRCQLTQTI
jgi:hypothetical protein